MKLISVFNNKGGVGKTTLTFHLAHALSEMGHKTLLIDVDPQCNLTIQCLQPEQIQAIWEVEDAFIDDFRAARNKITDSDFASVLGQTRTIHFLLKPTEDGVSDLESLPPAVKVANNLSLIPGRLSMYLFEDTLSRRWSQIYQGEPLAIRTATRIRELARAYAEEHGFEFVIVDTSPSLNSLNKVVISTADGFLIPCMPDLFSVYGIRNIGNALGYWKSEFDTIYRLLSDSKRSAFPSAFVRLLGYTIYNAKKYKGTSSRWDLAVGHLNFAKQLPGVIRKFVPQEVRDTVDDKVMAEPIGGTSVMHSHNTAASMAQKYHYPIWRLPSIDLEPDDAMTIRGNRASYEGTRDAYKNFAISLLSRVGAL